MKSQPLYLGCVCLILDVLRFTFRIDFLSKSFFVKTSCYKIFEMFTKSKLYDKRDVLDLKEKDQKQLTVTRMKVFLKPNCLVQISCKSDYKQESYWIMKI